MAVQVNGEDQKEPLTFGSPDNRRRSLQLQKVDRLNDEDCKMTIRILRKKLIHFEFFNLQSAIWIEAYLVLLLALTGYTAAWGAVGCDLNDPDRDVARLFPESTGYKTHYVSIDRKGGEPLLAKVETRLGDKFRGHL